MILTLPLPAKGLSPNAHTHWRNRHRLTKRARYIARILTLEALHGQPAPALTSYRLRFYFPTRARRDDDNAAASFKSYRDGIADALGIDDTTLRMSATPELLHDPANPRLEVILS